MQTSKYQVKTHSISHEITGRFLLLNQGLLHFIKFFKYENAEQITQMEINIVVYVNLYVIYMVNCLEKKAKEIVVYTMDSIS